MAFSRPLTQSLPCSLDPSSHSFPAPLPLRAVLFSPGTSRTPRIWEQQETIGGPSLHIGGTGDPDCPKAMWPPLPSPPPYPALPAPLCLSSDVPGLRPPSTSPQPLAGFPGAGARKGRTKREAAANTNRPSPGGHERKLVTKLQNTERKRRGARS